jgi:hypothetical protein
MHLLKPIFFFFFFVSFFFFFFPLCQVGTNIAYFLHRPGPLLFDLGFELLPEIGPEWQFLSEICFVVLFVSGLGTCLSPLVVRYSTPRYATLMLMRFFTAASVAQTLRVASFLSTLLPGPNYHCRVGSPEYNPPRLLEIFTRLDALKGCGDLIFSSHTIFTTLCVLTVGKYAGHRALRNVLAALLIVLVVLVICARKHYTVDCVIALYVTPLVWHYLDTVHPDDVPQDAPQSAAFAAVGAAAPEQDVELLERGEAQSKQRDM